AGADERGASRHRVAGELGCPIRPASQLTRLSDPRELTRGLDHDMAAEIAGAARDAMIGEIPVGRPESIDDRADPPADELRRSRAGVTEHDVGFAAQQIDELE